MAWEVIFENNLMDGIIWWVGERKVRDFSMSREWRFMCPPTHSPIGEPPSLLAPENTTNSLVDARDACPTPWKNSLPRPAP